MRYFRVILCIVIIILAFNLQYILADQKTYLKFKGTVKDINNNPIPNVKVTITYENTILREVSNKDGTFEFELPKTLQKEKDVGGLWVLLSLLGPGVLGLLIATIAKGRAKWKWPSENPFFIAFLGGLFWLGAFLFLLLRLEHFGHPYKISLFHSDLSFEFYVPILGFIGALLYVLDIYRKGKEDIPKGMEFGMRLFMAPYVAIFMVILSGHDLGFLKLDSPVAEGVIAFFSGLLVVTAFQGLVEKGQEMLGQWRLKSRYVPSEVAKRFNLSREEDLKLRKMGIHLLIQLREKEEQDLRKEARKVGFDENVIITFKKELEEEKKLINFVGFSVWKKLESRGIKTIEEFARLKKEEIERIAEEEPKNEINELLILKDKAKNL